MGFLGFRRRDGRVGVRNHVVVMSSVSCANAVVERIGREVPEVRTVTHTEGCGRGPTDFTVTLRTLGGVASHPNVGGVVVVGLGCEALRASFVADQAAEGTPVEYLEIQDHGGTPGSIRSGAEAARRLLARTVEEARQEVDFEHLTLAMECGGSDSMSGLTANPCLGQVADWLVEQGGRVLLSEITEFIGTEEILAERCATAVVRDELLALLDRHREWVRGELGPLANMVIAPGNAEGGLSTIAEKSLGCIQKGGGSPIVQVVDYAEPPTEPGLVVMNTPGSDIFSITGMIAGGAQLVLFTTGRGTPAGSPIAPVLKVSSNSGLYRRMTDDIDFDAGRVLAGRSLVDLGSELVDLVVDVAAGAPTKAEQHRTELFAIHTAGAAF